MDSAESLAADGSSADCYDYPQYWDLAFADETQAEADFIEAVAAKYCDFPVRRVLEPGCGGGRQLAELTERGFDVYGCDQSTAAVQFARSRLPEAVRSQVAVDDMRTWKTDQPVDLAYCFVNTFRHLLTEEDARRHLQTVACSVRPGGLYLIGMHLMPPDADEEDEEDWSIQEQGIHIDMRLMVTSFSRITRQETLRFWMDVQEDGQRLKFQTDYHMRIYDAGQMQLLLASVPEFQLLDVYDFWYDINEPQVLSDEMGDTVFVLRRTEL
jgi:SAM-dependent methyltransferase